MEDLTVSLNVSAEKKDIRNQDVESKNPAWLVEHNRKLRESAVWRTFKKTYEMQRKIEKDCCYNLERDEEEMYGFKKQFFYNNEHFYDMT